MIGVPIRFIGRTGYIVGGIEIDGIIIPEIDTEVYDEIERRETHWMGMRDIYYPRFFGKATYHIGDERTLQTFTGMDVFFQLVSYLNTGQNQDGWVPRVFPVYGDWKTTIWLTKE